MTTNVGRAPVSDGDATDDDAEEDAAIAISVINNVSNVTIDTGSTLTSGGATSIVSNNLVTATSIADGMLGGSDAGGGTLAMTTVTGDTILSINGAVVTAAGDVNLLANTIRSAKTQATATPGGTKDDGDSTTTTRGESELDTADAKTSEGSVEFAAAIAIGNLTGNTKAEINNATVKSTGGNLTHQAKAKHTVITTADSSTTSSESDSGIGVAVAIQHTNVDALALVGGNSSLDGNNVIIDGQRDTAVFTVDALSGATGTNSSDDIGFAGALAIGVTVANARAKIQDAATVNLRSKSCLEQQFQDDDYSARTSTR